MNSFYLWSQSLDNSSPDHIFVNDKELDAKKDLVERKNAVSLVSKVTANSKPQKVGQHVTIYIDSENFVLTAILPDLDVLNRKAPILCYGQRADPGDKVFSKQVFLYIFNFIKRINRTLPSEVEYEIKQALSLAKKKPILQRETILVAVLLLFILLLLLAFWFAFIGKSG